MSLGKYISRFSHFYYLKFESTLMYLKYALLKLLLWYYYYYYSISFPPLSDLYMFGHLYLQGEVKCLTYNADRMISAWREKGHAYLLFQFKCFKYNDESVTLSKIAEEGKYLIENITKNKEFFPT